MLEEKVEKSVAENPLLLSREEKIGDEEKSQRPTNITNNKESHTNKTNMSKRFDLKELEKAVERNMETIQTIADMGFVLDEAGASDPFRKLREPSVAPGELPPGTDMPKILRGLMYEPLKDFEVTSSQQLIHSPLFLLTMERVLGMQEVKMYIDDRTQSMKTRLRTSSYPLTELMVAMAIAGVKPPDQPMMSVLEAIRHVPAYRDTYNLTRQDMAVKEKMRLAAAGVKRSSTKDASHHFEVVERGEQWLGTLEDYERAKEQYKEELKEHLEDVLAKRKSVSDPAPVAPDRRKYWDIGEERNYLQKLVFKGIPMARDIKGERSKKKVVEEPVAGITVADEPAAKKRGGGKGKKVTVVEAAEPEPVPAPPPAPAKVKKTKEDKAQEKEIKALEREARKLEKLDKKTMKKAEAMVKLAIKRAREEPIEKMEEEEEYVFPPDEEVEEDDEPEAEDPSRAEEMLKRGGI